MYDVMISGYYGFRNSGDDAILLAIINDIKRIKKDIKIVVLSVNPQETSRLYGVDSINRFNILEIYQTMSKTKLFINGGGSLIQDITSTRSLIYYLSMIFLAKKKGLKVMMYANGIGPINKNNKAITRWILNKVDMITLRENASLKVLKEMNVILPKVKVTADPAFTLEPIQDNLVDEIFRREKIDITKPVVTFSMRQWKNCPDLGDVIAKIADYMVEKYGITPLFIPMHHNKDLEVTKYVLSKMKHKGYVIKKRYSVPSLLGIIKRSEIMIGMRLHSLIYATSVLVPIVAIAYESKVDAFAEQIGQISINNIENVNFEILKSAVDNIWKDKEKISIHLELTRNKLKEKAFENASIAMEMFKED